jgi:hypothetical protein
VKFRTEIDPVPFDNPVEHHHRIITLGSCFADNISAYLEKYRFRVLSNPFGVLFNPVSILNSLKLAAGKKRFCRDDLVEHQGEWHSFSHHSDFSSHDPDAVLEKINTGLKEVFDFLQSADLAVITYGTSFTYRLKSTGETVSNCHRIPASEFTRYRLSSEEIEDSVSMLINLLSSINKETRFIFTVSPVRHWKDGAVENQLSKSLLITALHRALDNFQNADYFPSYELMMDDLRDYRFYDADLLHPNSMATDYIWEKFAGSCFSGECRRAVDDMGKLAAAMDHRPRNQESPEHKKFLKENLKYTGEVSKKYSYIDFSRELEYFSGE